jgi:glycosyltransferase involved in cell wall biosynthesis
VRGIDTRSTGEQFLEAASMSAPIPVLLMARELGLGGSERQLTEVARSLDRSRFSPHVGCMSAGGLRTEALKAAGVPVVTFPVRSFYQPSTVACATELISFIRKAGIRLVHTFDTPMNLFGVPPAWLSRGPVVLSSQRAFRELSSGVQRRLLRVTDHLADGVVVNCEVLRRHLIEDERVSASKIHVCYNGIDLAEFNPGDRQPCDSVTIGVVCALRPEKGLSTLIEAFSRIRGQAKLVIVGSGPIRDELRWKAEPLGDRCRFEPATNSVAARLRRMDIFVLPSLSEALSNSLMEAMACGCAVVASRVGGNVELVAEGRTGLLFEKENADQLAAALDRLIADELLRREIGSAAARFIHDGFSLGTSVTRMQSIYDTMLSI